MASQNDPISSLSVQCTQKNGGVGEMAKASVIQPRDPGSNIGSDRKYFLILFVSHKNVLIQPKRGKL
jgi:hypothetical protein